MLPVFLPEPKKIKMLGNSFALPAQTSVGICSWELRVIAESLAGMLDKCNVVISVPQINDTFTLAMANNLKNEGYRLSINTKGVCIQGNGVIGVRHGLKTLGQVICQSDGFKLPCLEIEDWPDFAARGIYYDVARGRVPLLERLFELADCMAEYKLNELQLYIEHTFCFRRHPVIGKGADPLTADDIMLLDNYCRTRGVELVPSLASFGHMHTILQHEQYHSLAEDRGRCEYNKNAGKIIPEFSKNLIGQSLAPANPKVYKFLDELYGEFLPCFSSKKFNVCCDETWDLGLGQSFDLAQKIGKGNLYLGHIKKLNEISKKYGKRIQFWGDIIRHYPELIKDIPGDVTVLDWGYNSTENFDRIKDFTKTNLESYACPSVGSYFTLFPRVPEARANIAGWARAGVRHGATGILNTDWGDGGHYNFMEYSWIGYLFGAEQSWNHQADQKSFTSRFCKLFLDIDDKEFIAALDEMGDISHLKSTALYQSIWLHLFFATPWHGLFIHKMTDCEVSEKGVLGKRTIPFDADMGRATLRRLEHIKKVFVAQARKKDVDPQGVLPYWIFAVDATSHAARKLTVFGHGGRNTQATRNALKTEMKGLMKRFEQLWMERNRRSEIKITLDKYKDTLAAIDKKTPVNPWVGGAMKFLMLSRIVQRPKTGVADADCVSLKEKLGWQRVDAAGSSETGFVSAHFRYEDADGMVFLGGKVKVEQGGRWTVVLGHDGGAKVFVDGSEVFCEPVRKNPCIKDRSRFDLELSRGEHEIMIAFDLDHGNGWGVFFCFEIPKDERKPSRRGCFPRQMENG